jgi:hypothetical protein
MNPGSDYLYIEEAVYPFLIDLNIIETTEPVVLSFDEADRGRPDYKIIDKTVLTEETPIHLLLAYAQRYNKKLYII